MPTLTAEQRAAFDETRFVSVGYVYISQPQVVFQAPLTGGFFSAGAVVALAYGTPTIGAFGDIEPEMTLELWNADYNAYGSQRIRAAASATAIFVGRSAQGNKIGELHIADGAVIKVFKERRAFAKIPYIAPNGNQEKDTLVYPGDNAAQPPVANAGPDQLIVVPETSSSATIALNALGSVPSFAVRQDASLSSYLWDLDDGSVVTGSLTASSLTASFPLGERYVSLRVTDSNGITHTAYKFVVAARPSQCIPVQIAEEILRPGGVNWRFTVNLDELPAGVREGTKVLYTQHDDYALSQVAVRFSGWLGPEDFELQSAEEQQWQITITCHDVATRLRQIHGFPLTVEVAGGTSGWYRLPNANIDRLTHHYLQWHTNLLSLADFSWSGQGATYPLPRFTTDGASIWEQGDRLARAIGYTLTCNSPGQIRVKGDPLVLPSASQATQYNLPTQRTATEVTTLTDADYGEYDFTAGIPPGTHWLRGSAVVAATTAANITAVKAAAPSKTPGQGSATQEETEQLVTSQLEFNCRLANRYAARVNPRMGRLTLNMVKSRHIVEPADMEWVRVILGEKARAKYPDLSEAGERYLVSELVNRYDLKKLRKNSTWVLEREFEGVVNSDMTVIDPPPPQQPSNPNNNYSDWSDNYVPVEPTVTPIQVIYGIPPLAETGQGMVAFLNTGKIAVTNNFDNPSYLGGPTWTVYDHTATLGNFVTQFCRQPGSTDVTGWIVTDEKIWKVSNAQGATPTFTEQLDFGYASDYRNIDVDGLFTPGLFAVAASVGDDGIVRETRTLNGGTSWGSETEFGDLDGYLTYEVNFANGLDGWTLFLGSLSGTGVRWENGDPGNVADVRRSFTSDLNVRMVEVEVFRHNGQQAVFSDGTRVILRPTAGSSVGQVDFIITDGDPNGTVIQCHHDTTPNPYREIIVQASVEHSPGEPDAYVEIRKITIWVEAPSPLPLRQITTDGCTNLAEITYVPGLHVSTEEAGKILAGLGIPDMASETPIYVAEDYEFSYVTDNDLVDDNGLLTGLIARVSDDDMVYYGYNSDGPSSISATYDDTNNLFRGTVDDGEFDITPIVDSVRYGPDWQRGRFTIAVSSADGNVVCFVGCPLDRSKYGVFITNGALTAVPNWIQLVEADETTLFRRCLFSADASSLLVFGVSAAIAYSDNPLNPAALDSRRGDLDVIHGEIIGVAGF